MNEHIHYLNEVNSYKELINKLSKSISKKYFSKNNNNDTLNLLVSLFSKTKSFIFSISKNFFINIHSINRLKYKIELIILLMIFLVSYVVGYEEIKNIPNHLLASAYFSSGKISYLSFDNTQLIFNEIDEENINLEDINFDELNEIIKEKINKNKLIIEDNKIHCKSDPVNINNNKEFSYIYNINISDNPNNNIFNAKLKEELIEEIKNKIGSNQKTNFYQEKTINVKEENIFMLYNDIIKKILINFISFVIMFLFIKFTLNSRVRGSFIFDLFFLILNSYLLLYFYKIKIYLASDFFFILVIYTNKNFIDSIYLKLRFKRRDFEIFSTSLMAFDFKQFYLKSLVLIISTFLSGILSIYFFPSFLNYIIFYICLFTFIVFISNTVEPIVPYILKPIKNLVIFSTGIVNFIFSKIVLKNHFKNIEIQNNNVYLKKNNYTKSDTLYLIIDLFSLFCFDYIRGYLDFQIEINLLVDNIIDNNGELSRAKIINLALNQLGTWVFLLWASILIGIIGIFKKEYICLFMSIYLSKLFMNYFCNLYDVKLSKYIYYFHSFLFILINLEISSNENTYLINLFSSLLSINKDVVSFIIRLLILLTIIYYIIVINMILYNSFIDKLKIEKEKEEMKKEDKNNNFLKEWKNFLFGTSKIFYKFIDVFFDCFINYFIICLVIKIFISYEKSQIFKVLYGLILIIFFLIKLFIISKIINKFKYYFYLFIWLLLSLRLIYITHTKLSFVFFINHLNIFLFMLMYILNEKNHYIFSFIFIIALFFVYCKLNSFMIIIDIILAFTTFISINIINNINTNDNNEDNEYQNNEIMEEKEKNEENGNMNIYNSLSLLFLLPILIFFGLQLKFQNYFNFLNIIEKIVSEILEKIYILYDESNRSKIIKEPIEFIIISKMVYVLQIVSANF